MVFVNFIIGKKRRHRAVEAIIEFLDTVIETIDRNQVALVVGSIKTEFLTQSDTFFDPGTLEGGKTQCVPSGR